MKMKRKEGAGVVPVIMTLVVIAGLFLIIVKPVVVSVIEKEERRECYVWQSRARSGIRGFKPSHDMKTQCDRWGIGLDIPTFGEDLDNFDVSEAKKKEVKI